MTDFDEIRANLDLLNDNELVSILRERDEEQWRPEVFDIVASLLKERGVSPEMEIKHKESLPDERAGLDLVVVGNYFSYQDAEADCLVLEEKGLSAWIFNEDSPQDAGSVCNTQLKVLPEDLTAAMAILNSEHVSSSELPADIAEPPCPKCGSRHVTEQAEIVESFDVSTDLSRPTAQQMWFYKCVSCGYKWPESNDDR
jgi:DNA-directed RNA polymerase subunit M/transcription elongation factor TFIIS